MQASRSTNRIPNSVGKRGRDPRGISARPAARRRIWPWVLLGVLVVAGIVLALLPASLLTRALPPEVQANDFSGTLWHGSAGKIIVQGKDMGALEWHLHPVALLRLALEADLHWVKVGTVLDGTVQLSRGSLSARNIRGGGSLDDLVDLGLSRGWHGNATVALDQLKTDFHSITAAVGILSVSGISSPQLAAGSDLGNYEIRLGADSIAPDGTLNVALNDTGGPVELQAQIHVPPGTRTGLLTGVIRERPEASQALRDQISSLGQLRPRDTAGRIPVDLEFSL